MQKFYKTVDLLGDEVIHWIKPKKDLMRDCDDYDSFCEKFTPKKTSDDCYTPPNVYNAVIEWISTRYNLEEKNIIRPFFPGGDYENVFYPKNCIVVDNPPFSILGKILEFYKEFGIQYFLFSPHLTLFGNSNAKNYIVTGTPISYENGAVVATSFVSNIFDNKKIIVAGDLRNSIMKVNKKETRILPKYQYPSNLLTVSRLSKILKKGLCFDIEENQIEKISQLESQKPYNKTIFGYGFLMSEKTKKSIETLDAEAEAAEASGLVLEFSLSEREREIISRLGKE